MSRRNFLKQTSLLSLGIIDDPMYGSVFSFEANKDVINSHNVLQYKADMNWDNLNPQKTPVKDCHEIIQEVKTIKIEEISDWHDGASKNVWILIDEWIFN